MLISVEVRENLKAEQGIYVTEACDRCGQILGPIPWDGGRRMANEVDGPVGSKDGEIRRLKALLNPRDGRAGIQTDKTPKSGSIVEHSEKEGKMEVDNPTPNNPAEDALDVFVQHLNRGMPHPLDDDRFYRFIVVAQEQGSPLDEVDLRSRLIDRYSCSEELAKRYADRYAAGRKTLLKQMRMEIGDESAVW